MVHVIIESINKQIDEKEIKICKKLKTQNVWRYYLEIP